MTRIGNDTKATQAKGTTSGDDAKGAAPAESAPSLDELTGAQLDPQAEKLTAMLGPLWGQPVPAGAGLAGAHEKGVAPEGALPLAELPVMERIGALEAECALEVNGCGYELSALAEHASASDAPSLERASAALTGAATKANAQAPGSGLLPLADGVAAARADVAQVAEPEVKEKGEGILSRALGAIGRSRAALAGVVEQMLPEPAAGEGYEIGAAGGFGVSVLEASSKDVLSIARERGADGSPGDYVVAREVGVGVGLKSTSPGAAAELGDAELKARPELEAGAKAEGTIKWEYKSATLEGAHDRAATLLRNKAITTGTAMVPTLGAPLAPLVDAALNDGEGASAVVYTGSAAAEVAGKTSVLKAELAPKSSYSVRHELTDGKVTRGEAAFTTQVEGGLILPLLSRGLGREGAEPKLAGESKLVVANAAFTSTAAFEVDAAGEERVTGRRLQATLDLATPAGGRSLTIELPPGEDAAAVRALLLEGQALKAYERLLSSRGTVSLDATSSQEHAVGLEAEAQVSAKGRFHYKRTSRQPLERREGTVADILEETLPRLGSQQEGAALEHQLARHRPVG